MEPSVAAAGFFFFFFGDQRVDLFGVFSLSQVH